MLQVPAVSVLYVRQFGSGVTGTRKRIPSFDAPIMGSIDHRILTRGMYGPIKTNRNSALLATLIVWNHTCRNI
jgi:hypothetical protein